MYTYLQTRPTSTDTALKKLGNSRKPRSLSKYTKLQNTYRAQREFSLAFSQRRLFAKKLEFSKARGRPLDTSRNRPLIFFTL